jgi:uncharacterized membrane protein YjgN (DUF898 family)
VPRDSCDYSGVDHPLANFEKQPAVGSLFRIRRAGMVVAGMVVAGMVVAGMVVLTTLCASAGVSQTEST